MTATQSGPTKEQLAREIIGDEVVHEDLKGFDYGDLDQTPGGVSL